jgi:hypothetical protein
MIWYMQLLLRFEGPNFVLKYKNCSPEAGVIPGGWKVVFAM